MTKNPSKAKTTSGPGKFTNKVKLVIPPTNRDTMIAESSSLLKGKDLESREMLLGLVQNLWKRQQF